MKTDNRISLKLPADLSKAVRALIKADGQHMGWIAGTTMYCCALISDGIKFRKLTQLPGNRKCLPK